MTTLKRFIDDDRRGRVAQLVLDDGSPCHVWIARYGALVRRSKHGLFGERLYEEKNPYEVARTSLALAALHPEDRTPAALTHPVLASFVNAVLHCESPEAVARVLNEARQRQEAASREPGDPYSGSWGEATLVA